MNDFKKLAEQALVINELRVIINTSGQGVYSKDVGTIMRQTLSRLEKEFVSSLLTNIEQPTVVDINKRIAEEKAKLITKEQGHLPVNENVKTSVGSDGSTVVTVDPPKQQQEQQDVKQVQATVSATESGVYTVEPGKDDTDKVDLSAILREEKAKVAKKKKP